jgi:ApaG protein
MQASTNIQIKVETTFLNDYPTDEDSFPFAYKIAITNNSDSMVQLINRYWLITDGNGKKTEVHGAGVIGKQPYIKQGETYEYSSGAILDTPVGAMEGYYELKTETGEWLQAPVDVFSLAAPNIVN